MAGLGGTQGQHDAFCYEVGPLTYGDRHVRRLGVAVGGVGGLGPQGPAWGLRVGDGHLGHNVEGVLLGRVKTGQGDVVPGGLQVGPVVQALGVGGGVPNVVGDGAGHLVPLQVREAGRVVNRGLEVGRGRGFLGAGRGGAERYSDGSQGDGGDNDQCSDKVAVSWRHGLRPSLRPVW